MRGGFIHSPITQIILLLASLVFIFYSFVPDDPRTREVQACLDEYTAIQKEIVPVMLDGGGSIDVTKNQERAKLAYIKLKETVGKTPHALVPKEAWSIVGKSE